MKKKATAPTEKKVIRRPRPTTKNAPICVRFDDSREQKLEAMTQFYKMKTRTQLFENLIDRGYRWMRREVNS